MTPPPWDARIWRVAGDPSMPPDPVAGQGVLVPGAPEGPLRGLTVAVKDVLAVAGHPIGAGVPARLDEAGPEPRHATAVRRLLDAGAGVRGIARTDQLAYSLAGTNEHDLRAVGGPPPNARVTGAIPGGSSSGSGAAVATGDADLGLGTDTAGSIRVPASYQGIWGIRTTHGAVDRTGALPLAPSFDTVGLLARDAGTLVAATTALLDTGAGLQPVQPSFAVDPQLLDGVDPDVVVAFEHALDAVRRLGPVEEVRLPAAAEVAEAFRVHQAWQAWQAHGAWVEAHPEALLGDVRSRFEVAARITPEQAAVAERNLARLGPQLAAPLEGRVLVVPAAASAAPPLTGGAEQRERARAATLRLTCPAGVTRRPAVSAPVMSTDAGPVGLCLVGPRHTDVALLRLAARLAAD